MNSDSPTQRRLIVALLDISGFAKACRAHSNRQVFELLDEFYEMTGRGVEKAGGQVIKFMGDAALIVFPADTPEAAVAALRELQTQVDVWLPRLGENCRLQVKAHLGDVVCGLLGTADDKRFDVIGQTVIDLFLALAGEWWLSPELARALAD